MTPPKKLLTATAADAASFFQRGKKSSTRQRVLVGKPSLSQEKQQVSSPSPTHPVQERTLTPESTAPDSDNSDENTHDDHDIDHEGPISNNDAHAIANESFAFDELDSEALDEIRSDGSWDESPSAVDKEDNTLSVLTRNDNDAGHFEITTETRVTRGSKRDLFTEIRASPPSSSDRGSSAPRSTTSINGIHQSDVSKNEKVLRQFDLASKFGPCIDLTRLERWERAFELGLDPPQQVKDLLMRHQGMNKAIFEGRV
ncbi:hypothetical protein EDD11_005654 [Mortierella claussenii]|nr:hypothetical protein EDD11_005654 [Mortierella claussenii]